MSDYLLQQGTKRTPQSEPITGSTQVPNSAGGYTWAIDDWTRLRRFLILGSEGGSYYASERDLTTENVQAVRRCIDANGPRTVDEIVEVSVRGRAPKNDAALYALAACISLGDLETKRAAEAALPQVARIGTHLYRFVAYMETMRGWGRLARRAVSSWYDRNPEQLALQAIKYRQRDGWSHRDLLRLAHPTTENAETAALFGWIAHRTDPPHVYDGESGDAIPPAYARLIEGFERASMATTPKETAALVTEYNLPREALQSEHLNAPEVWDAMLGQGMPMTAMVRNLATMTRVGVLTPMSTGTRIVLEALGDAETLRRSRIHPISVLAALLTYKSGHGFRGSNIWDPVAQIVDGLDGAFYDSFGNVTSTGKRTLLALDVSGSMMSGDVGGVPGLDPRMASAAMAMVTARTELLWECVGFYASGGSRYGMSTGRGNYGRSGADGLEPLALSPRQRLDDVIRTVSDLPFGGTDCALPMLYACAHRRDFDQFVIYTDSETWAGGVHPAQALRQYRADFVPDAKLVVVGMVANQFTIADPNDAGMMDVVGFDTATPEIISGFARGEL